MARRRRRLEGARRRSKLRAERGWVGAADASGSAPRSSAGCRRLAPSALRLSQTASRSVTQREQRDRTRRGAHVTVRPCVPRAAGSPAPRHHGRTAACEWTERRAGAAGLAVGQRDAVRGLDRARSASGARRDASTGRWAIGHAGRVVDERTTALVGAARSDTPARRGDASAAPAAFSSAHGPRADAAACDGRSAAHASTDPSAGRRAHARAERSAGGHVDGLPAPQCQGRAVVPRRGQGCLSLGAWSVQRSLGAR